MILKGSQRSGALKLAAHLLRLDENVEVEELRGFSAVDLRSALQEADAIAKGTRCKQFLFSLSLNPPETKRVSVEQFRLAIDRAEETLGLCGQARAIVFHEKEGRPHAHVVWSRIDVGRMAAPQTITYDRTLLSRYGEKLTDMDVTDAQKAEFLAALFQIMQGFVDLGFSIGAQEKFAPGAPLGMDDVLEYLIPKGTAHETVAPPQ